MKFFDFEDRKTDCYPFHNYDFSVSGLHQTASFVIGVCERYGTVESVAEH